MEMEMEMEMEMLLSFFGGFFHPHDLIFCEKEVVHLNGNEEIFCCACSKSLAGASFHCCGECYFFLHKICAELPRTIKHPSHRKHPLILHPNSPYTYCDMCQLEILSFRYNCDDCDFDLDIDCAMHAQCFIQPDGHKHHFTKWYKSDPFTCDFCGTYTEKNQSLSSSTIDKLQPWICSVCHVVVHNKCMSLPFSVQLSQHVHPLIHTYFIPQSHESIDLICGICSQQVNGEFGCYSCESCSCVVHVECALENVQQVGQKFWAEEIEAAEDQLVEQEMELFIHPHHKLVLVQNHDDDDHEIETKCDGCMRIISYPFYKCLQCDFSLHIFCSKLPRQINHPLHQEHPLFLVECSKLGAYCSTCRTWSQGFFYHCLTCCCFKIDVRCALVNPFEFYHDSHKHPLSMYTQINKHPLCTSCGKGKGKDDSLDYLLRCKHLCPFALHIGCATLPSTIKYEYDEHSLILSYPGDGNSNLHHDSNQYPYCDICQEYRDPDLWFYACPNYSECPNYLHPKCAQVDHPYVKLGTRIISYLHEHELVFTRWREDSLPCYWCSNKDKQVSLECYKDDCNFSVHWFCIVDARARFED